MTANYLQGVEIIPTGQLNAFYPWVWQPRGPIAKSDGERDAEQQSPAMTPRTHHIKLLFILVRMDGLVWFDSVYLSYQNQDHPLCSW